MILIFLLNYQMILRINIEEKNPNKKRKIFIAFDDMIADMLSNKKAKHLFCFYYTILFCCAKKC